MPPMKKCSKCGISKPLSEFYSDKRRLDGKYPHCKTCHAKYTRKLKDTEKYKEWSRNYNKEFSASHRELRRFWQKNRKFRLRSGGGGIQYDDWIDLCSRYGNKCLCCGRTDVELTLDHVIPISLGGPNRIDNIQPLCASCNSKKHTKTKDYRRLYAS